MWTWDIKTTSLLVFSTPISIAASCMKNLQEAKKGTFELLTYSPILQTHSMLHFGHKSPLFLLVVSRNFNYAINFSCNAVNFNFAESAEDDMDDVVFGK